MSYLPVLLHQYAALHPVMHVSLPPSSPTTNLDLARAQPWLVDHLLADPRLTLFPPARDYQRSFWKMIVARLEEGCASADEVEELEVHEDIYEAFLATIQSGAPVMSTDASPFAGSAPPSSSFKTFFFPSPSSPPSLTGEPQVHPLAVTLREEQKTIQAGTTGLRTWGASLRLAELFLADPTALQPAHGDQSRHILELGSGVGFLGLFVARLAQNLGGESSSSGLKVTMTDFDERVLAALQENVKINGFSEAEVGVQCLNWEDSLTADDSAPPAFRPETLTPPDLIVAADVVYDPSIIAPLVATLVLLLSAPPPSPATAASRLPRAAIIASTVRNQTTFDSFVAEAASRGLHAEELSQGKAQRIFWGAEEGGAGELEVRILKFTMR